MRPYYHESRVVQEDSADPVLNLREHINDHIVETQYRGETQCFLPLGNLSCVVTASAVRDELEKDDGVFLSRDEEADLIRFVMNKARKTSACVVYSGLPMTCLKALIDDGLDDSKFPFTVENCWRHKHNQLFRAAFLNNQKIFNAAFFRFWVRSSS